MTNPQDEYDPTAGAKLVSVTSLIVTFSEYVDANGADLHVVSVNPTKRTRLDSAVGILTLGIGLLNKFNDAYLDPEAGELRFDDPNNPSEE
jgi:hypothetical protein